MASLILLNKPFNVLCQFTDKEGRSTLADYIKTPGVYPAGRLDYDSEGLLLLTDSGALQSRIADPKNKMTKTYLVQVEGSPDDNSLQRLRDGVTLKDGPTRPAKVAICPPPDLWDRQPPVRQRNNDITTWLEITISEGRNRQVRRMTAHIGHPTLRLVRIAIGPWSLKDIGQPGEFTRIEVNLPETAKPRPRTDKSATRHSKKRQSSDNSSGHNAKPKSNSKTKTKTRTNRQLQKKANKPR